MIIGLTGGIGSGKSSAAQIFEFLGIPVFIADEVSKKLLDEAPIQKKLTALLGQDVLQESKINRAKMAGLIFNDESLLQAVNNILHPAVRRAFARWHQGQAPAPYYLREAAILFESGSDEDCDKVITITAPRELRIARVAARSGESREQIEQRMARQWPEEEKIRRSDFVIHNDQKHSLIEEVWRVHKAILKQTRI